MGPFLQTNSCLSRMMLIRQKDSKGNYQQRKFLSDCSIEHKIRRLWKYTGKADGSLMTSSDRSTKLLMLWRLLWRMHIREVIPIITTKFKVFGNCWSLKSIQNIRNSSYKGTLKGKNKKIYKRIWKSNNHYNWVEIGN